ncbi:MAG TPA: hypothetical protein VFG14_06830 [Chthoniobacteraceae bacterium]|nr:hypothetical protein [Chthoniobacteraceae bacterium]
MIGPPLTLATGTLGHAWIGLLITIGGTFYIVRDALHYLSPVRRNVTSIGVAVLFCAIWIAIGVGIIAMCVALLPPDSD